ncbi:MAG: GNAT family N-acetyltransferase [Candidatus Peribacteria bacterium]|jgi:RimJ/RimL family protein N-acetyltransferase|nr:GNAT family N-acetyltransferase [Candidatus Peribacteria bacterium]
MKHFQKIVGEKVYLSPLHPNDYELFTKRMNDPQITDNTGGSTAITSLLSERKRVENLATESSNLTGNNTYNFTIVKKENNEVVGNIGLREIHYIHRTAMLGIMIGERDEHHKGYGTDAMNCILDYAFNILNLNNIILHVYDFNEKAKKCYEKC